MNRKGTMHKYTDMTNLYYDINFRGNNYEYA